MKKLKNIYLFIPFILLFFLVSLLSISYLENKIRANQTQQLIFFNKYIEQLYLSFGTEDFVSLLKDKDQLKINSFGFYNFYGSIILSEGTVPHKLTEASQKSYYNEKENSTIIETDLLKPFKKGRIKANIKPINELNQKIFSKGQMKSKERKLKDIRFIYLAIDDNQFYSFEKSFRKIQILVTLLMLFLFSYLGLLFKKNINYQKQIDTQRNLILLGTAARTLSHEIKNPLSSIMLQTSIIRRITDKEIEKPLSIIDDEINRLKLLSVDIGDFLRNPAGKPIKLDPIHFINDIITKQNPPINFITGSNTDDLQVKIDKDRFQSIIENLIKNAIESGSKRDQIVITIKKSGLNALILFRDKGKGIAKSKLDNIFDPFFTTKPRGSGVGLSLVKNFIEAANGTIKISSVESVGTDVKIYLPLARG